MLEVGYVLLGMCIVHVPILTRAGVLIPYTYVHVHADACLGCHCTVYPLQKRKG